MEQLLGREAWSSLKETTSVAVWRKYILKTLKAIRLSIRETVHVRDKAWADAIEENLSRGEKSAADSKDIDDLLASFTATLIRQVFLQLGACPDRRRQERVALTKENWRMDRQRSLQYTQTLEQLESVFWSVQQSQMGVEEQMELHDKYRWSKSPLPYSEWCKYSEA